MDPRGALVVIAVLAALGGAFAPPARAEEVKSAFKGLSKNSDKPIDIFSKTLTVYDDKKLAVFKGNVRANQGTSTLRAAQLDVHYIGGANTLTGQPAPAPESMQGPSQDGADADAKSRIKKIEAHGNVVINSEDNQTTTCDWLLYDVPAQKVTVRGNVVITSEEDQTTTSDWAIYDVAAQKAVVGGNVVLSQGQNVLKGDRLNIDLATGESRFENTGTTADGSRRIRALLLPKDEKKKPGKEKETPGEAGASRRAKFGSRRFNAGNGSIVGKRARKTVVPVQSERIARAARVRVSRRTLAMNVAELVRHRFL
ncbi:hypothetical protein AUC68_01320 [Methyloceanibacter methanicus]|uniref:Organic solvent tolerance-like N-terminal domain-containing protein n=2 Tax=Methyloceanibacter methanicus TaxID=1774968 RepID=A0A1E3W234_9HYPH|nr:hypothetical protein AUC68_01320 [Methyloceanibacter methanicus]